MAVTYAVSNRTADVQGSKRVVRGLLTATGTYTANGDAVTPALFGLAVLENLFITNFNNGSTTVPVSLEVHPLKQTDGTWKLTVSANVVGAVNTGTVAAGSTVTLSAGQTLTNFVGSFEAIGR